MSVQIVLDNNNQDQQKTTFQAGRVITGSIQIKISSASFSVRGSFAQAELTWTCSSDLQFERKIQVTTGDPVTRTFDAGATLFHHKLLLTQRTFLPAASQRGEDGGTIIFPFDIRVPEFAEPIASETGLSAMETVVYSPDDPWPGSPNFYLLADVGHQPQRLPGSSRKSFFYTSGQFIRFKGSINYTLQATLHGVKKSASLRPVVVNQIPDFDLAAFDQWVGRKHEAQVRVTGGHHMAFWRRSFSKEHSASIDLSIELQSKQALMLNARDDEYLPIRIRVKTHPQADDSSQGGSTASPKIYLTNLCLSLKGQVAARTNPSQKAEYLPYCAHGLDERKIFEWRKVSNRRAQEEIPLNTFWDAGIGLGATYDALKSKISNGSQASRRSQPMDLVPDFCIPNLTRNYSLAWNLTLKCGATEINWVYGGGNELGLPIMLQAASVRAEAMEELPGYEPM